jgi:stress response protein YsnF
MAHDLHIPIVEEEAWIAKRRIETERVSVHTWAQEDAVTLREDLVREQLDISRVTIGVQVDRAPDVRQEGDVTIVPVLEERLVVEKRLFLVEELHIRRLVAVEPVEVPTTVRRTRVSVERTASDQQEDLNDRTHR